MHSVEGGPEYLHIRQFKLCLPTVFIAVISVLIIYLGERRNKHLRNSLNNEEYWDIESVELIASPLGETRSNSDTFFSACSYTSSKTVCAEGEKERKCQVQEITPSIILILLGLFKLHIMQL